MLVINSIEQGIVIDHITAGLGAKILNYLDIDYFDPTRFPALWPPWKPHVYYIPSAPGELTSFLDSINAILREVEKLNIGGISQTGTELLENLNKAVVDAQVDKVSHDLQSLINDSNSILQKARIPELSADAAKFLGELQSSNRELRQILKNLEPATKLNPSDIKQIVNNLTAPSANLEKLSAAVNQRPSLLLWGTPPKSPTPKPTPAKKR